jgi:hypothetical protein
MAENIGVRITGAGLAQIADDLQLLAGVEVLVGFPEETTQREMDTGDTDSYGKAMLGMKEDLTNATLGYIHDNGAPEAHIPARPFMIPGIMAAEEKLTNKLGQVLKATLQGKGAVTIEQGMHQVGLIAKLSIQNTINDGIPPPLADSTLRARARKGRKGAGIELLSRSKGNAPSMDFAKPLVDTAQLRNAVNYAIRARTKRKK